MTILEKAKNLVNPIKWAQGFMVKKFAKKAAQFGAGALVALLANEKVTHALADWGLSFNLDKEALASAIAVALVGIIGGVFNTAKHGPLKTEGDIPDAPPASPDLK